MRLVFMGLPGAGKGTQAELLSAELGVPHISTGALFRQHIEGDTALGREADRQLAAGDLVPDRITDAMVRHRLAEPDARAGCVLDGYPRTVAQAKALTELLAAGSLALDAVVNFDLPEALMLQRLLRRGRPDDTEPVIRYRLRIYRARTQPLLAYYAGILLTIPAAGDVEEIAARVREALGVRS